MEDEVLSTLYKQVEAIDQSIESKETQLRGQQNANLTLFEILVKSEPVDLAHFGSWATEQPIATIESDVSLPVASPAAWMAMPVGVTGQWAYIIRDNVVVVVEIENLNSDSYVAEVSGAIVVTAGDTAEWKKSCRSCLLVFGPGDSLYPRQTNCLKPFEKALLVVCTSIPRNLLSSELVLIGQACVRKITAEVEERYLPPLLDPKFWRYWSGELGRIQSRQFDASGTSVPILRSLVDAFESARRTGSDIRSSRMLLSSFYVCQEQRRFRLSEAGNDCEREIANIKLRRCFSSTDEAKYCQLPLFDGILVFEPAASEGSEFLISGWTSDQVDQFARFSGLPLADTSPKIDSEKDTNPAVYDSALEKIRDMCRGNAAQRSGSGEVIGVAGDKYRELRTDICAAELLKWL